jgi:hypothetical protein
MTMIAMTIMRGELESWKWGKGLGSFYLPCLAYCRQRSSRLQAGRSYRAPLASAGEPRTTLDSTHRILLRAHAHAPGEMREKS